VLTLRNRDSRPSTVRVEVYRWSQRDGADVFEPASDMIASPSLATIVPGASQLVRVGPRTTASAAAYRVIVSEVPLAGEPGTSVKVALRLDLPLFVAGDPHAQPELSWSARLAADGDLTVEGANSGARHGRILGISVDVDGREIASSSRLGTVLAHSARRWTLGSHRELTAGVPVELRIRSEQGEVAAYSVKLGRP
jgi:fimbrial chaperone protein